MSKKRHSHGAGSHSAGSRAPLAGPTQRQLRAGELIRHALVDILREDDLADPVLAGVSITVSEVRLSPDLKHAVCFVEPLGAGLGGAGLWGAGAIEAAPEGAAAAVEHRPEAVVAALNRGAKFLRGRLGRVIDMKFTPDLKFFHDESFDAAGHMNRLFEDPRVRRDLEAHAGDGGDED